MSRSASDVSIITVNWNGKEHLENLLPSLLSLRAREIIVVDNGSDDGSVEWIRSQHPTVRVLENSTNQGFCQPNNLAASAARGSVLAMINNDAKADPKWLQAGLERLTGEVRCVASRILNWEGDRIDYNGSSLQYLGYALQKDIGRLISEVSDGDRVLFPCGGAMLIERDYFLDLGGFDEDFFAVYEDVDLGWRIWIQGGEVVLAPDSVVYHRGHGTLSQHPDSKMRYLMHRNALLTILKNYEHEFLRKVFPAALILAVRRAILLSGVRRNSFYLWDEPARLPARHVDRIDGLCHLVAVDDVLRTLPQTMRKRERVQQRRERSDSEILRLFDDPFRTIVRDPDYVEGEIELQRLFDLDSLFQAKPDFEVLSLLPDQMQEELKGLRRELQWIRTVGESVRLHPMAGGGGAGFRKLFQIWRMDGLRGALRWVRGKSRAV